MLKGACHFAFGAAVALASLLQATHGHFAEASEALAYRCTFAIAIYTSFEDGEWRPELGPTSFEFVLAAIDREAGSAQIVGNAGAASTTLIVGLGKETFLEITPSGTVQATVVYTGSPQQSDGGLPAVHSRHTGIVGGAPFPSQQYGFCTPLS